MESRLDSIDRNQAIPFPTTRWSLVFGGRRGDMQPGAADVMGQLCQIYWRPIFCFIRRQGYSEAEAQDLTQDFFLVFLGGRLLQIADPDRGRFRSLLLKSLQNFLIDENVKRRRQKRGGAVQFVPWDDWKSKSASEAPEPLTAETQFDLRWAETLAQEALRRLREECESKGHRQLYDVFSRYLDSDRAEISYRDISMLLSLSELSVKRLMHKFRRRFRTIVQEELKKTIENEDDMEDEIRYLCAALSLVGA